MSTPFDDATASQILAVLKADNELLRQQLDSKDAELWGHIQKILSLEQQLTTREKQIALLRETLQMIFDANPREWEELSCPTTEFERWAKSRANHTLAATEDLSNCILCDAEPIFQWRKRSGDGPWHDDTKEVAYDRIDEHYEARTLYKARKA